MVEISNKSLWSLAIHLKLYGPLYVAYAYYDDNNKRHGHAVIITGIDLVNGYVYTNNPWYYTCVQSYDGFMNSLYRSSHDYCVEKCFYFVEEE